MFSTVSKKAVIALLGLSAAASLGLAGAANAGALGGKERAGAEQSEAQEDAKEGQMLASARVSLADAARLAEQRTGLKASEAELDDEAASAAWEISVGAGAQEKIVMVDAASGQITSVAADDGESEDGADRD